MDILEKVKYIVSRHLKIEKERIQEESSMVEDFEADQFDLVQIIMDVEYEFNISIIEEEMPKVILIKDVVEYVKAHLPSRSARALT